MEDTLPEVLGLLERLVAVDTRNPPRAIDRGGIFTVLAEALGPSFTTEIIDIGDGCISLLATRGAPTLLFNVHVDTVPADPGWTDEPLRLRVEGDRAIGLGACDIKGGAAALVVAARRAKGDAALLFTSDEEAGSSRCVRNFLDRPLPYRGVVVAEPTRCKAILEHRGIATCTGLFHGTGGHASSPRALDDSAIHEAVRWGSRALAFAQENEARRYKTLSGIRFNLGVLHGGTKANMIASAAELRFGVRPLPDQDPETLITTIAELAPRGDRVTWTPGFLAPPLLDRGPKVHADGPISAPGPVLGNLPSSAALAAEFGFAIGEPVDFWTEAALFSEAGLPAIVYGPGDIAQAHTAGEWVRLAELREAEAAYARILSV
ncbi:Acetylornithine deacetylase [Minicystis rosea]|nr:Acetylornithine deacetylase [Minicystis rosea]